LVAGPYIKLNSLSWVLDCDVPVAVSFWDHPEFFRNQGLFADGDVALIGQMWRSAACRFVISSELGDKLCEDFGERDYEIVTDGVSEFGMTKEMKDQQEYVVYFMGEYHSFYAENFLSLVQALEGVGRIVDRRFLLRVRSAWRPTFQPSQHVSIESLPLGDDSAVAKDLSTADFLYLPLPFSTTDQIFGKYSLSTKMVSYLASGRPIIYHGPSTSAAGRLLARHHAAICLNTLELEPSISLLASMVRDITGIRNVTTSALALARSRFCASEIRERFWKTLLPAISSPPVPKMSTSTDRSPAQCESR
jgi:hypothetical protein